MPGLLKRIAKFGLVGVLNTLIDIALFWLLYSVFGVPYLVANVLSFGAGMLNSFVMNMILPNMKSSILEILTKLQNRFLITAGTSLFPSFGKGLLR